jgi:hypothetical protein
MNKRRQDIYEFAHKVAGAIFSVDITNFKNDEKKSKALDKRRVYRKKKLRRSEEIVEELPDLVKEIDKNRIDLAIDCLLFYISTKYLQTEMNDKQVLMIRRNLKTCMDTSLLELIPTIRKILDRLEESKD